MHLLDDNLLRMIFKCRYLGFMKGQVQNRAHPEGSLAEHIISCERYTFASRYLHGVKSTINCPIPRRQNEAFLGHWVDSKYPRELLEQAHMYVLSNIVCIEPYKR